MKLIKTKKAGGSRFHWYANSWCIMCGSKRHKPMLGIYDPGAHAVSITRHEAACILWDAWRKGKGATA